VEIGLNRGVGCSRAKGFLIEKAFALGQEQLLQLAPEAGRQT
jgi:hypothetical protein